jgi:hypothetical protein
MTKMMDDRRERKCLSPLFFTVKPGCESNATNAILKINPYNISHTGIRFLQLCPDAQTVFVGKKHVRTFCNNGH